MEILTKKKKKITDDENRWLPDQCVTFLSNLVFENLSDM